MASMCRFKVFFEKKIEIKSLLNTDLSQRKVERLSGVSQKYVFGVSDKLKQDLSLSNAMGQGRKRTTTLTEDRHLLRIMKKDRIKSNQMQAAEWNLFNGKNLCLSAVPYCLLSMGIQQNVNL